MPMASGILLSPGIVKVPPKPVGVPGTKDDGNLEAWEIVSQLKLKADLVVLSGCETAKGRVVRNDGLVGLSRAFRLAGARSVVASQWRVRDDSTRALLVRFHQELRTGVTKDEALRKARGSVARQPKWAHPYCWSGFVLLGDPSNPVLGRMHPTSASRGSGSGESARGG